MVEVVVVDLVAVLCVLHGEVVAGADKEEVPHHVPNHPLVQEPVVNMLPVRVLSLELQTLFNTALRWITKYCTTLPLLKQKKYCTTAIAMLKNEGSFHGNVQIIALHCHGNVHKFALHCHCIVQNMNFTAI